MAKKLKGYDSHRGIFPLSELVKRSAEEFGDRPVMRTGNTDDDGYTEITYNELNERVNAIARWLLEYGIKPGDRVAVLGENSPSWSASYLGIQVAGGTVVPVDRLMPPNGIRHILSDSGSRLLFVSSMYIDTVEEMQKVKNLEKFICFGDEGSEEVLHLEAIIDEGRKVKGVEFPKREMDELAAILYTSGTTGHSKGVMLTQNNIVSNVASAYQLFGIDSSHVFLSVLPVHHSFEATAGFLLPLYAGASITYAKSLKSADIVGGIRDTGVTFMVGVPLLFEKMMQGISRKLKQSGKLPLITKMMKLAKASKKVKLDLATPLFRGLRQKAGMDSVYYFVSGGGPLDPAVADFFGLLGFNLLQGYGLTETSPVTHVNPPSKINYVTVGPPIPGVEHKIVGQNDQGVGEICVKGPNVFKGYFNNEAATEEVLTPDGWFHTGDMGFIHKDNYLQITGRKKNMLVTGGGKNVYPEEIEHFLNRSDFIAESLVLGAPRAKGMGDEVVALIYPDYEQIDVKFEEKGEKASEEDVFQLVKAEIKVAQKELAEYKHIKRFRIVQEEFQKTSTRKVKRYLYNSEMVIMNGSAV